MEELQMDWLRSEDLKEEKNVTAPVVIIAVWALLGVANTWQGVPLGMHRTSPEHFGPDLSYRSPPTDFLREEPDDEEDEEEDDNEEDDDEEDDDGDEGYSE